MINNTSLIFKGDIENFSNAIKEKIKLGIFNNKVVPFYDDEVVEEMSSFNSINYIVTRGASIDDSSFTKITIYKELEGQIESIVPTVKDLIKSLNHIKDSAIPMLKQINWSIENNKEFEMLKLYNQFQSESEMDGLHLIRQFH